MPIRRSPAAAGRPVPLQASVLIRILAADWRPEGGQTQQLGQDAPGEGGESGHRAPAGSDQVLKLLEITQRAQSHFTHPSEEVLGEGRAV